MIFIISSYFISRSVQCPSRSFLFIFAEFLTSDSGKTSDVGAVDFEYDCVSADRTRRKSFWNVSVWPLTWPTIFVPIFIGRFYPNGVKVCINNGEGKKPWRKWTKRDQIQNPCLFREESFPWKLFYGFRCLRKIFLRSVSDCTAISCRVKTLC